MEANELARKYYGEDYQKLYSELRNKIINAIKNSKDYFVFRIQDVSFDDLLAKKNNPNYINPNLLVIKDHEIIVSFPDELILKDIEKHLSKNIKRLSLSEDYIISNIDFLSTLKDLEEITIVGYVRLNEELIKLIYDKTNVRKVFYEKDFGILPLKFENISFEENSKILAYKDMIIMPEGEMEEVHSIQMVSPKLNNQEMKNIYNALNITSLVSGISVAKERYGDDYVIENDGGIFRITIKDNTLKNLQPLCEYFISQGYNITDLVIDIRKASDVYSYDYRYLDKLQKSINVTIDTPHVGLISYEEFKSQVEGIKWFKELISQSDLSPFEKLIYAYDIMKTFPYREKEEFSSDSRNPAKILNDQYIVCSGYVSMLDEILKGMDPHVKHNDISVSCYDANKEYLGGHARSLVNIDDDKYGIHGIYILDPTWDSVKDSKRRFIDKDYTALDLYRYFMVPINQYGDVFPNDSFPWLFMNEKLNKEFSMEALADEIDKIKEESKKEEPNKFIDKTPIVNKILGYDTRKSVGDMELDELERRFKVGRISYDQLLSAIRAVRLKEGYTKENVDKEIERVSRVNAAFYKDGHPVSLEDIKKEM